MPRCGACAAQAVSDPGRDRQAGVWPRHGVSSSSLADDRGCGRDRNSVGLRWWRGGTLEVSLAGAMRGTQDSRGADCAYWMNLTTRATGRLYLQQSDAVHGSLGGAVAVQCAWMRFQQGGGVFLRDSG